MSRLCLFIIAAIIVLPCISYALNIEDKLTDPALESRARALFHEIRCMVCAGESIADSRAEHAKELRAVVRDKIKTGATDKQTIDYLTARYGDQALMQPPLKPATYLLWFGPVAMLLIGAIVMFLTKIRRPNIHDFD